MAVREDKIGDIRRDFTTAKSPPVKIVKAVLVLAAAATIFGKAPTYADEVALSFIHRTGRVDVPANALSKIKAHASRFYLVGEERKRVEFPMPFVEVCYGPVVRKQMCALTREIIDEPIDIVLGCETVASPVVRMPICGRCIDISVFEPVDAQVLAAKLQGKSTKECPGTS